METKINNKDKQIESLKKEVEISLNKTSQENSEIINFQECNKSETQIEISEKKPFTNFINIARNSFYSINKKLQSNFSKNSNHINDNMNLSNNGESSSPERDYIDSSTTNNNNINNSVYRRKKNSIQIEEHKALSTKNGIDNGSNISGLNINVTNLYDQENLFYQNNDRTSIHNNIFDPRKNTNDTINKDNDHVQENIIHNTISNSNYNLLTFESENVNHKNKQSKTNYKFNNQSPYYPNGNMIHIDNSSFENIHHQKVFDRFDLNIDRNIEIFDNDPNVSRGLNSKHYVALNNEYSTFSKEKKISSCNMLDNNKLNFSLLNKNENQKNGDILNQIKENFHSLSSYNNSLNNSFNNNNNNSNLSNNSGKFANFIVRKVSRNSKLNSLRRNYSVMCEDTKNKLDEELYEDKNENLISRKSQDFSYNKFLISRRKNYNTNHFEIEEDTNINRNNTRFAENVNHSNENDKEINLKENLFRNKCAKMNINIISDEFKSNHNSKEKNKQANLISNSPIHHDLEIMNKQMITFDYKNFKKADVNHISDFLSFCKNSDPANKAQNHEFEGNYRKMSSGQESKNKPKNENKSSSVVIKKSRTFSKQEHFSHNKYIKEKLQPSNKNLNLIENSNINEEPDVCTEPNNFHNNKFYLEKLSFDLNIENYLKLGNETSRNGDIHKFIMDSSIINDKIQDSENDTTMKSSKISNDYSFHNEDLSNKAETNKILSKDTITGVKKTRKTSNATVYAYSKVNSKIPEKGAKCSINISNAATNNSLAASNIKKLKSSLSHINNSNNMNFPKQHVPLKKLQTKNSLQVFKPSLNNPGDKKSNNHINNDNNNNNKLQITHSTNTIKGPQLSKNIEKSKPNSDKTNFKNTRKSSEILCKEKINTPHKNIFNNKEIEKINTKDSKIQNDGHNVNPNPNIRKEENRSKVSSIKMRKSYAQALKPSKIQKTEEAQDKKFQNLLDNNYNYISKKIKSPKNKMQLKSKTNKRLSKSVYDLKNEIYFNVNNDDVFSLKPNENFNLSDNENINDVENKDLQNKKNQYLVLNAQDESLQTLKKSSVSYKYLFNNINHDEKFIGKDKFQKFSVRSKSFVNLDKKKSNIFAHKNIEMECENKKVKNLHPEEIDKLTKHNKEKIDILTSNVYKNFSKNFLNLLHLSFLSKIFA